MAIPANNANYFYRMRNTTSTTTHQGLFYYSGTFMYGGLDGSTNEMWQLSGSKLKNAQTGTYIGGTTTAALVAAASAPTVTFEKGSSADTYYVKASTGKYLNWTSAGKLEWGSTKTTAWRFERLIQLTSIGGTASNKDFFNEKCGNTTGGTWSTTWTTKLNTLYYNLFKQTASQARTYYNLYGAMYNNSVNPSSYRGRFHTGIDMTYASNATIYAPITGVIKGIDRTKWGTVCIQKSSGVNYVMSHMVLSSIPQDSATFGVGKTITKGTVIGKQGNSGLGFASGVNTHVHFEVTSAANLCTTLNSHSSVAMGSTKIPYSYL